MLPNFANGISPGIQRDNLTGPWGILIFHVPLREGGGRGELLGGQKRKFTTVDLLTPN